MKSSIFLAATSAVVAAATPVVNRDVVYDVVTDVDVVVEYATVTVDAASPTAATSTATAASQPPQFLFGGNHRQGRPSATEATSTIVEPTTTAVATTAEEPDVIVYTVVETYGTTVEAAASVEVAATTEAAAATVEVAAAPSTTEAAATVEVTQVQEVASSTVASTYAAETSSSDMATNAIDAHNLHRANHSAAALEWLDEIATYAQTTAETCVFAHDMTQGSGNYGQNIAMWATSDNAAALGEAGAIGMATHDMWYNGEVDLFLPSYYGESTPDMSNFEAWGHFSQLVWNGSTHLGCHATLCEKGRMYADMDAWYMVCNYRPAGNVGGSYGANVLTSLGEATVTN